MAFRPVVVGGAAFVASLTVLAAPSAASPACEGYKGVANHGEHVITDYVLGAVVNDNDLESWPPTGIGDIVGEDGGAAVPGGPGPGWHFDVGAPPGASFCVPQANSGGRG